MALIVLIVLFVLIFPALPIGPQSEGMRWLAISSANCITIPGLDSSAVTADIDGFFSGALAVMPARLSPGVYAGDSREKGLTSAL
jgi:hypothetical protein